jgi:molybdopterin-guanine dinucleotide biosynthesis protein A
MKRNRQVAGFILAGGTSSRMGRDKALLELAGVPLLVRMAQLLDPLVVELTVVGPPERYAAFGLNAIDDQIVAGQDDVRRKGPLAGIARALTLSSTPWNLILACDLPYLSDEWLEWLVSRAIRSREQALIPCTEGGPEPLAAAYHREGAAPVAAALSRGVRKVTEALADLKVEWIHACEWRHLDPHDRILTNMNSPEDYEKARAWWEAKTLAERSHFMRSRRTEGRKPRAAPRPRR